MPSPASPASARIAAALEDAARGTNARGHRSVSAKLYETAARLTPETDAEDRARRVLAGASALFDAGDANHAEAIIKPLLEESPGGGARMMTVRLRFRCDSGSGTSVPLGPQPATAHLFPEFDEAIALGFGERLAVGQAAPGHRVGRTRI